MFYFPLFNATFSVFWGLIKSTKAARTFVRKYHHSQSLEPFPLPVVFGVSLSLKQQKSAVSTGGIRHFVVSRKNDLN